MKKLLIALAAVATGFFASTAVADAEALPTGVGFDSLEAETDLDISGDAHWTPSANVSEMKVKAWGAQEFPEGITRPAVPSGEDQANYLSVKTAFGNPLIRKALAEGAPEVTEGKIFFDSMVKFTATDEDPDTNYDNAKLIVYVKDNSEAEVNPSATTNLYVVAGNEKTTYDLGGINVDVWHRLTIKAVKAYAQGDELAFTVYVDQQPKAATEAAFAVTTDLNTEAKGINAAKRLFPSINACTSITEVGFDGQGCIDDLVFADTVDGEWVKENAFAITKGENITSYKWTVKSAGVEVDSATAKGDASIPAVANMTVEISDVVFATGSWKLAAETDGCNFEDGVFTGFDEGSTSAKLIAEDTTPRVAVTIGEAPAVTYPTLAKAFEAINALESGNVVVKFDRNYFTDGKVKVGTYLVEDVPYNEAVIASGADVTLDLAGCTIEGPDGYEGPALAFQSNVTIVDTVGGGKVVPVKGNTAAVMYLANLAIEGGTFDGAFVTGDGVEMPIGKITAIIGGSFLGSANNVEGKFSLKDAVDTTTYAITGDAESYFTVAKIPTGSFVVTVPDTAHVEEAVLYVNDDAQFGLTAEVKANDIVKVVATAAAHYEYDGKTSYESEPVTVTAAMISSGEGLAYTVETATATEYTFNYMDGENVFAPQTYTVETQELTLNAGTKQGYKLDGWYLDPEFEPDSKIESGADLLETLLDALDDEPVEAVYGKWEAEATDVTVTLTKGEGIATIKLDNSEVPEVQGKPGSTVTVTLAAADTIAIPVFKADGTTCGASYEITIPSEAKTIVFTAVDAKDAPTEEDAAAALVAAGVDSTAVAKVSSAKTLASWWEGAGKGATAADINASNYVKASVDLGVALITDSTVTAVNEETFAAADDALTFNIKVGDVAIDAKKAVDYVQVTDDLSTWSADNVTKTAADGAVKVTSTTGKAFAKVVISKDAK